MTRFPVGVSLFSWVLLSAIGLAGCGGTETGNPSGTASGIGGRNPAIRLEEEICGKLAFCFGDREGFTEEDCSRAIRDSEVLGPAFGITEKPPPGYGQVIERVDKDELSADEKAVDACLEAIRSLECGDPAVQAVAVEEGFTNIEEMIPESSCSHVFSAPSTGKGVQP